MLALRREGVGARRIAKRTALPLATVKDWLAGKLPRHSRPGLSQGEVPPPCAACGYDAHPFDELPDAYVYLLGLYLGDGSIATHPRGVYKLRAIFCQACDLLGIRWTAAVSRTIYVSRKADVARLDEFIGPKR